MVKWFITRIKSGQPFSWDDFDNSYQEATQSGDAYDSKYPLIQVAVKDTTDDILYICAKWLDPPQGSTHNPRMYDALFQTGKQVQKT